MIVIAISWMERRQVGIQDRAVRTVPFLKRVEKISRDIEGMKQVIRYGCIRSGRPVA